MATMNVPVKTPEALAELSSRQRKLSQRHRTVLLLVDGRRSEEEVRQVASQAGSPDSCFDDLLSLGMIAYAEPIALEPLPAEPPAAELPPAPAPLPLSEHHDSVLSVLPASLTLQPSLNDSILNEPPSTDMGALDEARITEGQDEVLEEARMILMRAVRAEAPVAGALTLLRLRRAVTREDLEALLDEVELRITKPFKGLWATQTMARVRELLSTQALA